MLMDSNNWGDKMETTLKYEGQFKVGDIIKALDFESRDGREDMYIEGIVLREEANGGELGRRAAYVIHVLDDSGDMHGHRVGHIGFIPFELDREFDNRITLVNKENRDAVNGPWKFVPSVLDSF
jgi:hypothetical protein